MSNKKFNLLNLLKNNIYLFGYDMNDILSKEKLFLKLKIINLTLLFLKNKFKNFHGYSRKNKNLIFYLIKYYKKKYNKDIIFPKFWDYYNNKHDRKIMKKIYYSFEEKESIKNKDIINNIISLKSNFKEIKLLNYIIKFLNFNNINYEIEYYKYSIYINIKINKWKPNGYHPVLRFSFHEKTSYEEITCLFDSFEDSTSKLVKVLKALKIINNKGEKKC